MKKSFDKIKQYFDTLNHDKEHFVNTNDICTPMDCVKEMANSIPINKFIKNHERKPIGCTQT